MSDTTPVDIAVAAVERYKQQRLQRAGCQRGGHNPDKCLRHSGAWPEDERACNVVLSILGYPARRYLGDGRAEGAPVSI